jgi:hypothetical protein
MQDSQDESKLDIYMVQTATVLCMHVFFLAKCMHVNEEHSNGTPWA